MGKHHVAWRVNDVLYRISRTEMVHTWSLRLFGKPIQLDEALHGVPGG